MMLRIHPCRQLSRQGLKGTSTASCLHLPECVYGYKFGIERHQLVLWLHIVMPVASVSTGVYQASY